MRLRKDRAEMVRQAERDEERIRDGSRAEHRRHHNVAQEAGHARDEREAADGEDAVDHRWSSPAKAGDPVTTALSWGTERP